MQIANKKKEAHALAGRLISRIVPNIEIWVIERLLAIQTLSRIEAQHLGKEIDCQRVGLGVQARERDFGLDRERANIVLCTRRTNAAKGVFGWSSQVVKNLVKLVDVTENIISKVTASQASTHSLPL